MLSTDIHTKYLKTGVVVFKHNTTLVSCIKNKLIHKCSRLMLREYTASRDQRNGSANRSTQSLDMIGLIITSVFMVCFPIRHLPKNQKGMIAIVRFTKFVASIFLNCKGNSKSLITRRTSLKSLCFLSPDVILPPTIGLK